MTRLEPDTLVYDQDCELCCWGKEMITRWDKQGRIRYLAFQDPRFEALFPDLDRDDPGGIWPYGEPPQAMLYCDRQGEVSKGVEAFRKMLPVLSGGKFIALLFYLPGASWLAIRMYEWLARNRYRLFGRSSRANP